MEIRFLMDCEGAEFGAVKKGDTRNLCAEIAQRLIKRGVAGNVSAAAPESKSKKKTSEVSENV